MLHNQVTRRNGCSKCGALKTKASCHVCAARNAQLLSAVHHTVLQLCENSTQGGRCVLRRYGM